MKLMFIVGSLMIPIQVGASIGLTTAALPVEHIIATAVRRHGRIGGCRHHRHRVCPRTSYDEGELSTSLLCLVTAVAGTIGVGISPSIAVT